MTTEESCAISARCRASADGDAMRVVVVKREWREQTSGVILVLNAGSPILAAAHGETQSALAWTARTSWSSDRGFRRGTSALWPALAFVSAALCVQGLPE